MTFKPFKRYLLFAFNPKAKKVKWGFKAFVRSFDELPQAQLFNKNKNYRFHQIVDLEEGRIVEEQE